MFISGPGLLVLSLIGSPCNLFSRTAQPSGFLKKRQTFYDLERQSLYCQCGLFSFPPESKPQSVSFAPVLWTAMDTTMRSLSGSFLKWTSASPLRAGASTADTDSTLQTCRWCQVWLPQPAKVLQHQLHRPRAFKFFHTFLCHGTHTLASGYKSTSLPDCVLALALF